MPLRRGRAGRNTRLDVLASPRGRLHFLFLFFNLFCVVRGWVVSGRRCQAGKGENRAPDSQLSLSPPQSCKGTEAVCILLGAASFKVYLLLIGWLCILSPCPGGCNPCMVRRKKCGLGFANHHNHDSSCICIANPACAWFSLTDRDSALILCSALTARALA